MKGYLCWGAALLVTFGQGLVSDPAHASRPFRNPPGHSDPYYLCDRWAAEAPRTRWILLDICEGFGSGPGPTEDQRHAIGEMGGRVRYEFHLPCIRAWLPVARVPELVKGRTTSAPVPHPQEYLVPIAIRINPPLSEAGQAFLETMGATEIVVREELPEFVSAIVPDKSLPALYAYGEFKMVFYSRVNGCGLSDEPGANLLSLPSRDPGAATTLNPGATSSTWGRLKGAYR